ncbi:MAG: bifunctional phosphoribosylaminoimidazolecarboxamide formyltransferase/IMP cyclohydrolase [Chloroflexi bacterium]|nr:bifunctional phosphoribosylaminoimidazolecarboxamide formyltransferase/IMP cyclohydrolase [Chloroflexota bacterium]
MRAILSVYDKRGLVSFAGGLVRLGYELSSTGGTLRTLREAGIPVGPVDALTGFPEMLDGRVRTLHPAIHGGILARRDRPDHLAELRRHGIAPIDLVANNLYPFAQTVADPSVALDVAIENIDIGGVTLLRAAAKNYLDVLPVVDPADYDMILAALQDGGAPVEMRRRLAAKAFAHTAAYDTAVAEFLRTADDLFPEVYTMAMAKVGDLRYGENPHQQAAVYRELSRYSALRDGVVQAEQLHGKALSYNNYLDADTAWLAAADFAAPTVAIVKHANPCGLASDAKLATAFRRALAGDPVSAYGGIVAANRPIDIETAGAIRDVFFEVVVAPGYDDAALEVLRGRRDLRILRLPVTPRPQVSVELAALQRELELRRIGGGFVVQTRDETAEDAVEVRVVTHRSPTLDELTDLLFGWRAVKHVRSNAIVLTRSLMLVGVGAGQPNRVTSVEIAARRAGERAVGAVLASDAFFPFPDGIEAAARAGVTAIIQPGGSIRDDDAIRVANDHHMAMVFTGRRHFRH